MQVRPVSGPRTRAPPTPPHEAPATRSSCRQGPCAETSLQGRGEATQQWVRRAGSLGGRSLCPGSYLLPLGFQISLGLIRVEKGPAPCGVPRSPLGSRRHPPCRLSRAQKPGPGRRPAASSPSYAPGRHGADEADQRPEVAAHSPAGRAACPACTPLAFLSLSPEASGEVTRIQWVLRSGGGDQGQQEEGVWGSLDGTRHRRGPGVSGLDPGLARQPPGCQAWRQSWSTRLVPFPLTGPWETTSLPTLHKEPRTNQS